MAETTRVQMVPSTIWKPQPFVQPRRARFRHEHLESDAHPGDGLETHKETGSNVKFKYTPRNNRKGRHALVVRPEDAASTAYDVPPYSDTLRAVFKGVWLMIVYYPIWDISWLVAYIFVWGSLVWVLNAFLVFTPELQPWRHLDNLVFYGGGITAFVGATLFEIGSILLLVEAFNANQSGCFGWAVENILEQNGRPVTRAVPDIHSCNHHHVNKDSLVGKPGYTPAEPWTWWPTSDQFRKHYLHDVGFIAAAAQMVGATIFWISGYTALPGIYDHLSANALLGAYWIPQAVGGVFFIISGLLFMIETQELWWLPAPRVLGWHIGLWNMIGGVGFTLCAVFGFDAYYGWAQYQSACSTFWGSWAFMIGSTLQWYESLNKHPVERA